MKRTRFGNKSAVCFALVASFFSDSASSPAQTPASQPASKPNELTERDKLAKQVDDLRWAGKFDEAMGVAERSLELERKAGAENQARVAEALFRMAELSELRGDWDRALARRKEALTVREHVDEKGDWRTADARLALAFTEKVAGLGVVERTQVEEALRMEHDLAGLKVRGNSAEAERAAVEVLKTYQAVFGPATAEAARVWNRIGRIRRSRNDARGAKESTEQALAIRRNLMPPGHPDIADSLHDLGMVQRALGDYVAAKSSQEESLAIFRKALPPGHPSIAATLTSLGIVQANLRAFTSAKANFEEVLVIRRKALPHGDPEIASCLSNLGMVHCELQEYGAAKASHAEALTIFERALSPEHPFVAKALSSLGIAQYKLGEYKAAKTSHTQALAIRRKVLRSGHPDIGGSLQNLGNTRLRLREYAAAKANFEESLAIFRAALAPDPVKIAASLYNLCEAQLDLREYSAAKASQLEALAIRRRALAPDDPQIARSLNRLGVVQKDLREYEAAKTSLEEALTIYRKTLPSTHPHIVTSLNNLGLVLLDLRQFTAAKAAHQEALGVRRKALPPGDLDIANSLNNLGNAQAALREFVSAKASHQESLAIRRKALPPDDPEVAVSLSNLGAVQLDQRDFRAAKGSFQEALAIYRKALPRDHPDIGESLNKLGLVHRHLLEYAAARTTFEEALALRRKSLPPGHPDIATSLSNIGIVHRLLQEYSVAKANHEEALAIRREALPPDHPDIAASLSNLGVLHETLREFEAARASHEEALSIRRNALPPGHPEIADSLANLGNIQTKLRDFVAAKASYEEALAIRRKALPPEHPEIAGSLNNLGSLHAIMRSYAAANAKFEEALAIRRKTLLENDPEVAHALSNLAALALNSGIDIGAAVPRLSEAIDILQVDQLRLAAAQAEAEQLASAAQARRSLHFLIDATHIVKGSPSAVYNRVVHVKGSVTAQQRWARQARDAADPDTVRLLDRLREVSGQTVSLSVDESSFHRSSDQQDVPALLRTLSGERARLERQLTERSAIYRTILDKIRVGADDVRAALPQGAALIDIVDYLHVESLATHEPEHSSNKRLMAFVVRPEKGHVVMVSLGPSKDLAELINRWRASSGADKTRPTGAPDPGAELRKRLWGPLAAHLQDVKLVLVSPDGPLNGLPWAALPGSKEGTYLIEEYAFAVVPVPQLLPELLRAKIRRAVESSSLVVGNIDFDSLPDLAHDAKRENHFPTLPGTMAEATAVHERFRASFASQPAELLTGKSATKEAFVSRAANCSHLLVATHGFFLSGTEQSESHGRGQLRFRDALQFRRGLVTTNPALRSGLVFAGANYQATGQGSAFLTALEASELDLHRIDLAVLSACETGLGKIEVGEGVLGLQRAFQLAGARTAVTSLWKVPDAATQALMTRFHRNLWETHMGKLEALREAQLWMIREGRNHPELQLRGGLVRPESTRREGDAVSPFYWAAFVLSGDWR
jgi:tetratricopeptide (TPR) repeat protein/CHAT domain-containing protein